MSEDNKNYGFLETHYYFYDDSHSMDALIKNKCDKALLNLVYEVNKELGWFKNLNVEVLPSSEGGLVELFKFMATPEGYDLFNTSLAFLALVSSRIPPQPRESKLDIEGKELAIEGQKIDNANKQLDNEIKKADLDNKKYKKALLKAKLSEIKERDKKTEDIKDEVDNLKEDIYNLLIENFQIRKNLSSFYKNLIDYEKVKAIGYTPYDRIFNPITPEKKVERNSFSDFVIDLDEYEEIDENAKIYIFSPSLVSGRYKWRGLYEKEDKIIDFSMNDKEFKEYVENGTIIFKNGSTIKALLNIKIKLDISGDETSRTYSVETVLEYSHGTGYTETIQGKNYKAKRKDEKAQLSILFNDEN
ncbi:hypothetical protein [Psychrobacter okhotskensis]|uniref:hypothetical protein n=1 Tax=Psychrobacter okhotskensis TaxID=212403 RepID=UPI00191B5624|nr:hypothetical protein [Psychrobacter okhotskensis]